MTYSAYKYTHKHTIATTHHQIHTNIVIYMLVNKGCVGSCNLQSTVNLQLLEYTKHMSMHHAGAEEATES